jgi:hypothetical protein
MKLNVCPFHILKSPQAITKLLSIEKPLIFGGSYDRDLVSRDRLASLILGDPLDFNVRTLISNSPTSEGHHRECGIYLSCPTSQEEIELGHRRIPETPHG